MSEPVRFVLRNPKKNYCPRKIPQHLGGCYCTVYVCCGRITGEPHAEDCAGYVVVIDPE